MKVDVDLRRLRECLSYDADIGVLRWKIKMSSTGMPGSEAGCLDHRGYRFVRLDRKLMLAHRIAWALHYGEWPEGDLDHINMDKGDNRIANLRLANRSQNNANSPAKNQRGMPKGCYQSKSTRRWYPKIRVNGKAMRLGAFDTAEEAAAAFERAHREHHGDFSRCEAR